MSKAPPKTNAARALERLKIAFRCVAYEVDESDLSAPTVARKVGMEPRTVFKTLLLRVEPLGKQASGEVMAVIPGDAELDLKAAAKLCGAKRAQLVALKEVQPLTGYIRGGVTALAAKKRFPVLLDESALEHEEIAVSAGMRGLQLVLKPQDYQRAVDALLGQLTQSE
ncbi:MAG: Cys-tRNA(Pro) deacylase [Polyangiaceae bacterium]